MTQILEGLDVHISIIDDMLIHGKSQKEHDERALAVLEKLDETGATLNPLVPLFGLKTLDELPPRIQRFRMRLMKYSFKIQHVPGRELVTADTLSRAPLDKQLSKEDDRLNEDLNLYVSHILDSFPATERKQDELRLHQQNDEVCRKLFDFCTEGWSD